MVHTHHREGPGEELEDSGPSKSSLDSCFRVVWDLRAETETIQYTRTTERDLERNWKIQVLRIEIETIQYTRTTELFRLCELKLKRYGTRTTERDLERNWKI